MADGKKGSVVSGMLWMALLSVLLFWLPVLGPLVAGIVGGKKSGGVAAAVMAVFLPAIVLGALLFLLATALSGIPLLGAIAGMGGFVLACAHVGPMLLGAIIGGLLG